MHRRQPHQTLGIMAKYWEKGHVKTRLAKSLAASDRISNRSFFDPNRNFFEVLQSGPATDTFELAARIHRVFLECLLDNLGRCGDVRELVGSPRERLDDFRDAFRNGDVRVNLSTDFSDHQSESPRDAWALTDQGDGDLGDRMYRWFARCLFARRSFTRRPFASDDHGGERACVLIGADCPLLSPADLDAAWSGLQDHDLVLGPAVDGGYYLIGLRYRSHAPVASFAALFAGIAWSTPSVLQDTLAAAKGAGLKSTLLPTRRDVDTAEDLEILIQTLRENGQANHPLLKSLGAVKFR